MTIRFHPPADEVASMPPQESRRRKRTLPTSKQSAAGDATTYKASHDAVHDHRVTSYPMYDSYPEESAIVEMKQQTNPVPSWPGPMVSRACSPSEIRQASHYGRSKPGVNVLKLHEELNGLSQDCKAIQRRVNQRYNPGPYPPNHTVSKASSLSRIPQASQHGLSESAPNEFFGQRMKLSQSRLELEDDPIFDPPEHMSTKPTSSRKTFQTCQNSHRDQDLSPTEAQERLGITQSRPESLQIQIDNSQDNEESPHETINRELKRVLGLTSRLGSAGSTKSAKAKWDRYDSPKTFTELLNGEISLRLSRQATLRKTFGLISATAVLSFFPWVVVLVALERSDDMSIWPAWFTTLVVAAIDINDFYKLWTDFWSMIDPTWILQRLLITGVLQKLCLILTIEYYGFVPAVLAIRVVPWLLRLCHQIFIPTHQAPIANKQEHATKIRPDDNKAAVWSPIATLVAWAAGGSIVQYVLIYISLFSNDSVVSRMLAAVTAIFLPSDWCPLPPAVREGSRQWARMYKDAEARKRSGNLQVPSICECLEAYLSHEQLTYRRTQAHDLVDQLFDGVNSSFSATRQTMDYWTLLWLCYQVHGVFQSLRTMLLERFEDFARQLGHRFPVWTRLRDYVSHIKASPRSQRTLGMLKRTNHQSRSFHDPDLLLGIRKALFILGTLLHIGAKIAKILSNEESENPQNIIWFINDMCFGVSWLMFFLRRLGAVMPLTCKESADAVAQLKVSRDELRVLLAQQKAELEALAALAKQRVGLKEGERLRWERDLHDLVGQMAQKRLPNRM